MPFHQPDEIRYYSFDILDAAGVINAVFTRRGGLSPPPWSSLNVGGLLGDDPARVIANRVLSFNTLGRSPESVYDAWQVHGTKVICATAPRPRHSPHEKADIILTDQPHVTLFMRFADCVPILLTDPIKNVVGLVHAGWQGTVKRSVLSALEKMKETYGCHSQDILAAIGPSIGAHHYPIGEEVVDQIRQTFKEASESFLPYFDGLVHFDLLATNHWLLSQAGVKEIENASICTACHLQDWYSHRGEQGNTGRFGVLIATRPD